MVVRQPESHHNGGMVAADIWVADVRQKKWEEVTSRAEGTTDGV